LRLELNFFKKMLTGKFCTAIMFEL